MCRRFKSVLRYQNAGRSPNRSEAKQNQCSRPCLRLRTVSGATAVGHREEAAAMGRSAYVQFKALRISSRTARNLYDRTHDNTGETADIALHLHCNFEARRPRLFRRRCFFRVRVCADLRPAFGPSAGRPVRAGFQSPTALAGQRGRTAESPRACGVIRLEFAQHA